MHTHGTTAKPPAKNERRDLISIIIACGVLTLLIVSSLVIDLANGRFNSALGAALPDGLYTADVTGGAYWILMIAIVGQNLVLIALILTIGFSVLHVMRGEIFSHRNAQLTNAASWLTLTWGILHFALEGLGNNLAAHQIGFDEWYDRPTTTDSSVAFWVIVIVLISSFAISIKRGMTLEEDIDGLV